MKASFVRVEVLNINGLSLRRFRHKTVARVTQIETLQIYVVISL